MFAKIWIYRILFLNLIIENNVQLKIYIMNVNKKNKVFKDFIHRLKT